MVGWGGETGKHRSSHLLQVDPMGPASGPSYFVL